MIPGEIIPGGAPVPLNPGRDRAILTVTNTGDRPVQVGSHYHFAAANPALTVAYLALVREMRPSAASGGSAEAVWQSWYRYFPWEDWRDGKPKSLAPIEVGLAIWAAAAPVDGERRLREERMRPGRGWKSFSSAIAGPGNVRKSQLRQSVVGPAHLAPQGRTLPDR